MTQKSLKTIWVILNLLTIFGCLYYSKTADGIDPEGHELIIYFMLLISTLPTLLASALAPYIFNNYDTRSVAVFILTYSIIGGLGYFQWFVLIPRIWRLLRRFMRDRGSK